MPENDIVSGGQVPADKLTFGFKLVVSMLCGVVAICLFIVNVTLSARQELNDLRYSLKDLSTRYETQAKLDDERNRGSMEAIARLDRLMNLEAYEIATLKYSISQAGIRIKYPPKYPVKEGN